MIRMQRTTEWAAVLLTLACTTPVWAQGSAQERAKVTQTRTQQVETAVKEQVRVQPGREQERQREPAGRPINLQIEVTISDQSGSEAVQKKTVTMIVADRTFGRIRSSAIAQFRETPGPVPVKLNVDAQPAIQANDAIRLGLTIEYEPLPQASGPDSARRPSPLNESLTVILQSGKPLTISRAADPLQDRKISVDVTATILK